MAERREPSAKALVAYIARRLVNQPDKVYVTQVQGASTNIVVLEVAKTDYGRMIGLWAAGWPWTKADAVGCLL